MSDGTASRIRIEKLRRYSIDPARTGSEGDNTGAAAERAHGMAEDLSRSGAPFTGAGGAEWYATLLSAEYRQCSDTWLAWAQLGEDSRVVGIVITQSAEDCDRLPGNLVDEEEEALLRQFGEEDEMVLRCELIDAEADITHPSRWSEALKKRIDDAANVVLALCSKEWEETDLLKTMIEKIAPDTDLIAYAYKQQSRYYEAGGFVPLGLEERDITVAGAVKRGTVYEECGVPSRVILVRLPGVESNVLASGASSD